MSTKFRTQYDRQRIHCCPGDRIRLEYELFYDDDGVESLREVGKVDIVEEICSHALSVDLNYILSRYAQGDPDALSRRQGVYGDFTTMPSSYAELLNRVIEAQNTFDLLPPDTKHLFGDSMSQWLASYGSDSWMKKMGFVVDKPVVTSDNKDGDNDVA